MLRLVKKGVISSVDWFLYQFLSVSQKEKLANMLTEKQKETLKRLMNPGKKRAQIRKIERMKYRLYELGFSEKAVDDLKLLIEEDHFLKKYAAWELAVWYVNQYCKDGAEQCLYYLEIALDGEKDNGAIRRAKILQAECYQRLGNTIQAYQLLEAELKHSQHVDLYLGLVSLSGDVKEKEQLLNEMYAMYHLSPITFAGEDHKTLYDRLTSPPSHSTDKKAKVSVIIPAYNSADTVGTSIEAMLQQTWSNLEILVVDDCSTDHTKEVIMKYVKQDERVKCLSTPENGGAYVARNVALQIATGDYVTINDADDWSHPEKIKTQVEHLEANQSIIANFSNQARTTNQLTFYRRGKPGIYTFANMSSFMFRRKEIVEKIGYWDSVRFAGDSEFVKRIKIVFGERSVVYLETAPLSFQRQTEESLTGNSAFGFPGYFMGARKEYKEAHEDYHKSGQSLYYPFPQEERPFPIPEPMWPKREDKLDGRRHFDVIIASEFRLLGGTNMSNVEEIKAQTSFGMRTGLVQLSRYDLNSATDMNPRVRELIDGDQVALLVYGEKVSCDVLIVRHPPILEEWQKYIPDIEAKQVRVIVNQPPKREYSQEGTTLYHIERCVKHLKEYVGQKGVWYPIGPSIREALEQHHANELKSIHLSDEDWVNIIDVNEWRRQQYERKAGVIRIGRHSRDQYVKWPSDREELLKVYPDHGPYEVHVLGGAKAPKEVLGEIPSNWTIYEFGSMAPKNFLKELDVFIYYTHPDWVEAFGRVIFEAMAVGVPVIIPPSYEPLFKEAAIYAKPEEVQAKVKQLMEDKSLYQKQVDLALTYVDEQFGYRQHSERLKRCLT